MRNNGRISGIILWLVCALLLPAALLTGCGGKDSAQSGAFELDRILHRYPALIRDKAEFATVKRVIDGDTFQLENGEKVRLIGVNTPEIHGKVQYYGRQAADFTNRELLGKEVVLFADVGNRDKYGRLLRYVFVAGDDAMFNERLVKEGFAQVMTVPPNVTYADLFVRRQREARSAGLGLWGGQSDKSR